MKPQKGYIMEKKLLQFISTLIPSSIKCPFCLSKETPSYIIINNKETSYCSDCESETTQFMNQKIEYQSFI